MYAFITGIIEEKDNNLVVLNCNGMGYEVFASNNTVQNIPAIGEVYTIHTYLHVREDAMVLFGFATKQEKEIFLKLITVSGIGAKTAIAILSGITPENLINAVALGDISLISTVKGIGKKTAERIILELKNSLGSLKDVALFNSAHNSIEPNSAKEEAIMLLVDIGLTKIDAVKIVNKVSLPTDSVEEIVAKSLKNMN